MSFAGKLMQAYFNFAYNPAYDFTTGRLDLYRKLQRTCIGKLELRNNDRVLCVGIGTGNEIFHILEINGNVNIVGVDYSKTALQKAYNKASRLGKEIELLVMDARYLDFTAGMFDKVICLHVMDFVEENDKVTGEIIRVLKDGGQFVITYPSEKEGGSLGRKIWEDILYHNMNSGRHRAIALTVSLAQMLAATVYLPLLLRPNKKSYLRHELEAMFLKLRTGDIHIEEEALYQDFIVYGTK